MFIFTLSCNAAQGKEENMGMKLTSPEFKNGSNIPSKFTCEGEDINPTLLIDDIPAGTKSLALIVDDPDAPVKTWVHWVVYDIDPAIKIIRENSIPGKQGINDFRRKDWGGPCPPSGTHRYYFKLYALDTALPELGAPTKMALEKAMEGHVLAKAELQGTYQKKR